MWISRFALPFALAVAVLLACFAPRDAEPAAKISARELLVLAQRASGQNYTFDKATGAALAALEVPRPGKEATQLELEASLRAAGFLLEPVGPPGKAIAFKVERVGG